MEDKLKNPLKKEYKLKENKEGETTKHEMSESKTEDVAEVVTCLMNASTSLHKLHLKVTGQGSFASHNALSGYDKFHDFADQLCEEAQGAFEELLVLTEIPIKVLNTKTEAIDYLNYIKDEITVLQSKLNFSELINLLDEIKSFINSIKYKLLFLQ